MFFSLFFILIKAKPYLVPLLGGMKAKNTKPLKRLNPLNDYLFLKVMGSKGDEVQLLGFLNAVLERTGHPKYDSVEIIENRALSAEFIGNSESGAPEQLKPLSPFLGIGKISQPHALIIFLEKHPLGAFLGGAKAK